MFSPAKRSSARCLLRCAPHGYTHHTQYAGKGKGHMTAHRERIPPEPEEVKRAEQLLAKIPTNGLDWTSAQGQEFLAYVEQLSMEGRPVPCVAEQLVLNINR